MLLLNASSGGLVVIIFVEIIIYTACLEGSGLNNIFHLKAQLAINLRSLSSTEDGII